MVRKVSLFLVFLFAVVLVTTSVIFPASASSILVRPTNVPGSIDNPWTIENFELYPLQPIPTKDENRVQSYCGPGSTYHGAGAYKTYKMSRIEGVFVEGSFVLVDMNYTTVGKRRVYFWKSAFESLANLPEAFMTGYNAQTTAKVIPTFGPGTDYDIFTQAVINADTNITVLFEENGYVFAEFECALGPVRAWIPVYYVQAN